MMSLMTLSLTSCHHNKPPSPAIDPTRELLPPIANIPPPVVVPPPKKKEKIHDAKIPAACVTDLDQEESDCRVTGNPNIARCNNILMKFACLSYRNQKKTIERTVKDSQR